MGYQFKTHRFAPMLPFPFLHCSLFVIRSYTGEIPSISQRRYTVGVQLISQMTSEEILKKYFGYDAFRGVQKDVIDTAVAGQDALVLMPTGGGKSLCYQIPALMRPGLAVVVSPLIALMKDQVDQLNDAGVSAVAINSSLTNDEARDIYRRLRQGTVKLLYVAPERLLKPSMLDFLETLEVNLFAVDEAHCISVWGHDFRPEYQQLDILRTRFPQVPRMALTATADEQTRQEIVDRLLINPKRFITSFDRPNIRYRMYEKGQGYLDQAVNFILGEHLHESGIIYCATRRRTEEVAELLQSRGIDALIYHAGLSAQERELNQKAFFERPCVMVATIAFGMGIDKPDVRFIIHVDMPRSIENYFQETGRAGRDGLPSEAVLFYGLEDVVQQRYFLENSEAEELHKQVCFHKLDSMLGLAEAVSCRRELLLSYFGEQSKACNNCDNCENPPQTKDASKDAQKLLSCIYRCAKTNQMGFGASHVINVLRGVATDKVFEKDHHELPTFGIGKEHSLKYWRKILRQLITRHYVDVNYDCYNVLSVNAKAKALLKGEESFFVRIDGRKQLCSRKVYDHDDLTDQEQKLFQVLRRWRSDIAHEKGLAAYNIFPDKTLVQIVRRKPRKPEQLEGICGIGEKRIENYGADVCQVINGWLATAA